MAKLFFRKEEGVIDAPLSCVAYEGNIDDIQIFLQEYIVICGDICERLQKRDEELQKLRDEMAKNGHTIEIESD